MKFDLSLQKYVEWEVSNVMPLKGKFGYRVFLIYMDGSKKPQQKAGFATEKEANAARDKTIGELYSGTYVVYANVLVKDFLEFWVEEDIQNRVASSETYETYSGIVNNHIIPVLGGRKMVELNRGDVQKLYNNKTDYSVSVARLVKTVMNVSMQYAVDKKVIAENPAEGVALPKKVSKKKYHTRNIDTQKTLTMDQILVLLEASRDTPIHMQVLFNVLMGLRRREINGVKFSDVDYINRTLKVQRQLGKKIGSKKEDFAPKTFTKQEVRLKTPSSYGRPRSKDFHWTHYKKLLADNGLPDIRWHDLRSTFCTILLKNDFNPKAVSKLMGHAKELITMDVYGDNRGIIADCVDELQPFIDEVMPDMETDGTLVTEGIDVVIAADSFLY